LLVVSISDRLMKLAVCDQLVSVYKWPFSAISASTGGIACAAYNSTPPHNAADFLELAKNCTYLIRKRISALYKTADGHQLNDMNLQANSRIA
jgi:hypothetical protein